MNLQCTPKASIGMIGSLAFLGAALSCFVMPMLGDIYGRMSVYYITTILQMPLYALANFGTSIMVLYVVTFCFGFALIGRFTNAFILITESTAYKDKAFVGTALLTTDILATYYCMIWIRLISNDCSIVIWIAAVMNLISIFFGFWQCESPPWLLSVGYKERAIKNMHFIAKFNGVNMNIGELLEDPEEEIEDDAPSDGAIENV